MTTKRVFALYGTANVGKSATLKKVFALLTDAYPGASVQTINTGIDITVIIEINGVLVGIETQGDPNGRLGESLELFKKAKCGIIICATRTTGGTVTAVENLQPEFKVVWHHMTSEPNANLRDQHDSSIAQTIFNEVQNALKA
jgi:hypothetical protein